MRRRGGRRSGPARMLRLFLIIGILLALIPMLAERAGAAEAEPITRCGDQVTWGLVETGHTPPAGAVPAIGWAYTVVEQVTGIRATWGDQADVRWEFQSEMSGGGGKRDGESYEESAFLSDRTYWVHAEDGDRDWTVDQFKSVALEDVLRDLGVAEPSSNAAGLSTADRRALRRICAVQERAEAASAAKSKRGETGGDTGVPVDVEDPVDAPEAAPRAAGSLILGWVLVAVVALMLGGYLASDKVIAAAGRVRGRVRGRWVARRARKRRTADPAAAEDGQ